MSPRPVVAHTRGELGVALEGLRSRGDLVLVPTMGALHAGHRALIRKAREGGRTTVVSIFVNPLQFGSADDLARYPRTLEADLEACAEDGVAVVWAPDSDEMYPAGRPRVTVSAGALGSLLEGASRPGHFDGVLTVVSKLFHQVRPDVAVFGAKDAQQLALVWGMVIDLDFEVSIESVPTVRDSDGLALSSRNARLSAAGRRSALAISASLEAVAMAAVDGVDAAVRAGRRRLDAEPGLVLDYLTLVDPSTFTELSPTAVGPALAVAAAEVEGTRLIDNVPVTLGDAGGVS